MFRMTRAAQLRRQAESKLKMAALIRQIGPTLSVPADRAMMAIHLRDLEEEASALEAEAAEIDSANTRQSE